MGVFRATLSARVSGQRSGREVRLPWATLLRAWGLCFWRLWQSELEVSEQGKKQNGNYVFRLS